MDAYRGCLPVLVLPLLVAAADPAVTVEQRGRAFLPDTLMLKRGQTVRFTNADAFPHQLYVEAEAMHYESGIQQPAATRDVTFASDGTFEVRCAIHPRMQLHVTVQ